VRADDRLVAALGDLAAALAEIPAPSMIIGGIAVIAAGVPRETIDIDATILGRSVRPEEVIDVLGRHGIEPRIPDALQFARERQILLLRHRPSGVTMEISFAWLPFEETALSRALPRELAGVALRIAAPEDLIIYKAAAWRDRDRSDIERLMGLHWSSLDLDRIRTLVGQISDALDDRERLKLFDGIVERVRRSLA